MKNAALRLLGAVALISTASCEQNSPAKICAAEDTLVTIRGLVLDTLSGDISGVDPMLLKQAFDDQVELDLIRFEGFDKETSMVTCRARLVATGADASGEITYTRQPDLGSGDHVYRVKLDETRAWFPISVVIANRYRALQSASQGMIPLAEAAQGATPTLPYNEAPQGATSMHQYKDDQGRWPGDVGYTQPRGEQPVPANQPRPAETAGATPVGEERGVSTLDRAPTTANVHSDAINQSSSGAERESGAAVITRTPPEPAPIAAPPRPQVINNPTWARAPQVQMPERALSRGIETGSVTLQCGVRPDGSLARCNIVRETPSGTGFGQEAAQAAVRARVTPRTVDILAPGGSVRFTVTFNNGRP